MINSMSCFPGSIYENSSFLVSSKYPYEAIHGKCVINRLYSAAYPIKPLKLKKVAMILSSGDADM